MAVFLVTVMRTSDLISHVLESGLLYAIVFM